MIRIAAGQARRFLLAKNGLLGENGLRGKEGVLAYVRQAGCVQYDPIDICGCSHELALLSRVKGFHRGMLPEMLYQDRTLIDFFDKNMCLMCTEDWPYLAFLRRGFRMRARESVEPAAQQLLHLAQERGWLSVQDLDGAWDPSLGRAALETLYFRGDLVIHHKTGEAKTYAPASACLPRALLEAPDPFRSDRERRLWQMLRRIGAVGMLWNAPSDAWLGVDGLSAQARCEDFALLERMGSIVPVEVEELSRPLYILRGDLPLLSRCGQPIAHDRRVRLLAPLDGMLWDRRLIAELFHFSYKWEVYTPESQRRYGYYVLPVLAGEGFAGRVEPVASRESDALLVRSFWPEAGLRLSDRFLWALEDELNILRRFLGLSRLVWDKDWLKEE